MEYLRLTKTLKDIGSLVKESEIPLLINESEPFFRSLYYYPEEGLEYFNSHGRIKGYKGEVSTPIVTFDVDCDDLEVSRINMIRLIDYLKSINMYREMAAVISFSGSKGYHLEIKTDYSFSPKELKKFCKHLATQVNFVEEAGFKVDPSVYNTNRIFRIANTLNEKSGLYKVNVTEQDLKDQTTDLIKEYAKSPKELFGYEDCIPEHIVKDILKGIKAKKPPKIDITKKVMPKKSKNIEDYGCYLAIQNGEIPAGESNSALLRLAQFYKDAGFTIDQTRDKLVVAGHERMNKYPETNEIDDEKIDYEILGCIYGGEGYTFGRSDDFLEEKCRGKCLLHNPATRNKSKELPMKKGFGNATKKTAIGKPKVGFKQHEVKQEQPTGLKTFQDSATSYKKYAETINDKVITTGIAELDKYAKILPTGITFINARPGVGKSSIMLNMIDNNQDLRSLVYQADMVEGEFYEKTKSKILKISPDDVRALYSQDDYADLRERADQEIADKFKNILINYDKRLTTQQIKSDLEYFKSIGKPVECVFIDYVQKLQGGGDYQRNMENIMELKAIQDEFKVPIVGLSQIPRQGGDEETPVLTAAAGKGGSIYEETGSIIINMWRPLKFAPEKGLDNAMMICIAKNRMGECPPPFPLHFNGAISEIRTMTEGELEEFEINMQAYAEAKKENKKLTGKFR